MKRGARPGQLLVVVMLALAGVGAGHIAEYLVLAPDQNERHELLVNTGHHYLPSALNAAAFVALMGLSLVFLLGVHRGIGRAGGRRSALRWSRVLPVAQVLAFVALEVGERVVAHASLADIGVVLAIGVPLQVLVGHLAGYVVAGLEQIGETLGVWVRDRAPRPRRTRAGSQRPVCAAHPPLSLSGAPIPARGPPLVVVSA